MQAGRDSKTKGGDAEEDAKSNRFLDASKVLSSSRAHEESISTAPMSSQAETKEERGRDADRKSNGPESLVESASPTPKLDSSHAHKEEERKGCEREEGDGDATEDATEQVSAESHQVGDQEKKEEGQDAAISNEFPRVTRRVEGAGSPTTIRQPFDEAVDAITEGFEESSALKGLRDQVDRLKTRTFRYEQKAFQDILRALEKVKEQMDKARDSGEQDGTTGTTRPRPRWTLFARHKKSLDDVCKEIEGKLAELMKEPYAPNPHGDLSTVYWKKAVQAASVVAQVFPIPGLDQLLSALTAHLDAMANEGDYVADAIPQLNEKCFSVPVRHGDKLLHESHGVPFSIYAEAIEEMLQCQQRPRGPEACSVFVSSEDPQVFQDAAQWSETINGCSVVSYNQERGDLEQAKAVTRWRRRRSLEIREATLSLLTHLECKSGGVGSRQSNWNRLIEELSLVWAGAVDAPYFDVDTIDRERTTDQSLCGW